MDTEFELKIENVIGGLRNYGYRILVRPIPGKEQEYYDLLREGMQRVDRTVDWLHKNARCRGRSKRTIRLLHQALPEPCWGVEA